MNAAVNESKIQWPKPVVVILTLSDAICDPRIFFVTYVPTYCLYLHDHRKRTANLLLYVNIHANETRKKPTRNFTTLP